MENCAKCNKEGTVVESPICAFCFMEAVETCEKESCERQEWTEDL